MGDRSDMSEPPIVFISYSHESDSHRERVLALAERLRADGIPATLDRYVNGTPVEGWPRWMLNRLEESDRVLLICTETYYRRFRGREVPNKGKGVDWEGAVVTQEIYDRRSTGTRFVPILFDPSDERFIPEPVRGQGFYCLSSKAAYRDLYDGLLGQAGVEPGPLGALQERASRRARPMTFGGESEPERTLSVGGSTPRHGPAENPFLGDSPEPTGRETELSRIFAKLRAGNHCSLVGPPGSGKTLLLQAVRARIRVELDWSESEICWANSRTIQNLRDLQEAIALQLGGRDARDWRGLMRTKPLRLLVLDNLGGMDTGAAGLKMRRWLRGLGDDYRTRLLPVSNDRLEMLFRKDDPTRDSPLAGIDAVPVELAPLAPENCLRLIASRLEGTGLCVRDYADLCSEPRQPKALLIGCAERFERLTRHSSGARP
jgi:hypothetical protein